MEYERSLIIIPIVHTYEDMGSLREQLRYDERYDTRVTEYWVQVFNYVNRLPVDFSRLKVYQDSLADTDSERVERIIAETQTANFEILRALKRKGALIIGTENQPLLAEEFQSLRAILNSPDEVSRQAFQLDYAKKSSRLLDARDKYIAKRIWLTLRQGDTGLLFIGAAHNVGRFLAEKMTVSEPEILRPLLTSILIDSLGVQDWKILRRVYTERNECAQDGSLLGNIE